jgi:biopolymer transport protein ExbB/TolQ
VVRVEVILGIAASVVTLSVFFFKAWANLRAGRRVERYRKSIDEQAQLELDRLRLELEEAQRGGSRKDS